MRIGWDCRMYIVKCDSEWGGQGGVVVGWLVRACVTCNWKPTLMSVHVASSIAGRTGCSCMKNKVIHVRTAIATVQRDARGATAAAMSTATSCGWAAVKIRQIVGVVRVVSMVCEMCTDRRYEWHFDERQILIEQIAFVYVHRMNCFVVVRTYTHHTQTQRRYGRDPGSRKMKTQNILFELMIQYIYNRESLLRDEMQVCVG